jgi:hypothetical protein
MEEKVMKIVAALCLPFGLFVAFAMSGAGAQQKENEENATKISA